MIHDFGFRKGMFLAAQGITSGPLWDRVAANLISLDGTEHRRLRRLVCQAFTPKATARQTTTITDVITALVDRCSPRGHCDVVTDIAHQYPIPIICALLGAPPQDWELFSAGPPAGADRDRTPRAGVTELRFGPRPIARPSIRVPEGMFRAAQGITSGPRWDRVATNIIILDGDQHHRLRRRRWVFIVGGGSSFDMADDGGPAISVSSRGGALEPTATDQPAQARVPATPSRHRPITRVSKVSHDCGVELGFV